MIKYFGGLVITCLIITVRSYAQDPGSGFNYQMTVISNPALTGSEGDGLIRLSYMNYYPGNNYNLHSVHLSYDGYFQALHGGAGFYISDNYLGSIVNDLKGGFSYSYIFRAGKDVFIGAGLSSSFYHRGYDMGGAILPDQIDPLGSTVLPSGEAISSRGRTILDIGTGFMFMTGNIYGGIAVNHLAEPVLSETDITRERLGRHILVHIAGDIYPGAERKYKICPAGKFEAGDGVVSAGAGASFESNYLSVNTLFLCDNFKNIDMQAGFSINAGEMLVFYNYRFNIVSGKAMLPFSILHHTGIAFRLNNVDKRKTIKTINFPKL